MTDKTLFFKFSLCFNLVNYVICAQPNIVLIVADDLGWNDFGFHGQNQIPTPNIDALAYNGVVLNRFYTQQTCTPSRAALLSGRYPMRLGLQGTPIRAGENRYMPVNVPLLPQKLKDLGYKTHLVGKWHLGCSRREYTPTRRGFDTHFGYWNGFIGYFDHLNNQNVDQINQTFIGYDFYNKFTPQWGLQGQYVTTLFRDKSVEIIENHDATRPLFLMVTHLAGHTGSNDTELGVPSVQEMNRRYPYIPNEMRRRLADLTNIMDESVGRIVEKLAQKSMLENSIIIFLSDNGPQTVGMYQNYASAYPFRGLKFTLHEGGVRGSVVIYSPLLNRKNYINNELMHITDILPTLFYAAGGDLTELSGIDGVNQWFTISENQTSQRSEILLNIDEAQNNHGYIGFNGRYKLLNGTYQNGIYDGFYGDSGRGSPNPEYSTDNILNSIANVAIQNSATGDILTSSTILNMRRNLDMDGCRPQNTSAISFVCRNFCLFDLVNDPCETRNVFNQSDRISAYLMTRLTQYFNVIVPQTNRPVDVNSNPRNFNDTWCTWLQPVFCRSTNTIFESLLLYWYLVCEVVKSFLGW